MLSLRRQLVALVDPGRGVSLGRDCGWWRDCGDQRLRLAARQAPSRFDGELGRPAEHRDRGGGLLKTQSEVNRQAALTERSTDIVTKKPLGRSFGARAVDHRFTI
jgi:hypothetical protein